MSSREVKISPKVIGYVDYDRPYFSGGRINLYNIPEGGIGKGIREGYLRFDRINKTGLTLNIVNSIAISYKNYYPVRVFIRKVTSNWDIPSINYANQPASAAYKDIDLKKLTQAETTTQLYQLNIDENTYGYKLVVDLNGSCTIPECYLSYMEYDPEINNFKVEGNDVSKPITCTWTPIDVKSWVLQVIKDDVVIAQKTGTTENTCTFKSSELTKSGDVTFKLIAKNDTQIEVTRNVSLQAPISKISGFTVSGTSIDKVITCTWKQEHVYHWTVQAIQGDKVIATQTGTSANSCIFNVGAFNKGGKTLFKITASNTWNSSTAESTVNLSYSQASIDIIDLPGVLINTDHNFTIAWVSSNQTRFKVELDGKVYTGTTAKSITIPKHTVSKGLQTVTITIYFENNYYSNHSTLSTKFTSYGKPSMPTITMLNLISSATPNITWTATEQVAYQLVLKRASTETVEQTGEVVSTAKYYTVKTALENNASYTIELKIKNAYDLWSDVVLFDFTTQFTVPNVPSISCLSTNNGSIILNVLTNRVGDSEYKNTEIWKKEPLGEWKRMAYNLNAEDAWEDFYCGGDVVYEYKARNIGKSGGIIESKIIQASTQVKYYTFYNVEDLQQSLTFRYDAKVTPTAVQNIEQNMFAGALAPMSETDGVVYFKCDMQFSSTHVGDIERLIHLMKHAQLLLYKDSKGHKYFGKIVNNPQFPRSDLGKIEFSLNFCEEAFLEQDVYDGGNEGKLPLVWGDGLWLFDGTRIYRE